MTRGERVVVLVWSLGDAVVWPGGSREIRRVAASKRVQCSACEGLGSSRDRFGREARCGVCGGKGSVWIDGYTGERVSAPGSPAAEPGLVVFWRRVGCAWCQEGDRGRWDAGRGTWVQAGRRFEGLPRGSGVRKGARCEPCDGTGWVQVPAELDLPGDRRREGPDDRVAWRITGSYAELARALDRLRAHDRDACRALLEEARLGTWPFPGEQGLAPRGLRFVERRMPSRIVVSGDVLAAWRARQERAELIRGPMRDHRIRELVAEGVPPRVVARRAGLSESQVRRIAYRNAT